MFGLIASGLDKRLGGWAIAIGLAPLFIAMLIGWISIARLNRQRVQNVVAELRRHGFDVLEKPTEVERLQFAAQMIPLFKALNLRTEAAGIQWCAVQGAGSHRAVLFEHEFFTGSGKSTREHHHTVLAWPAGHPDIGDPGLATGPWFFMGQYAWLMRREVRDRELKLPEFADLAKTWSLLHDSGTAARFLTPKVRAALERAPKQEAWAMGAGWVSCSFNGTLNAAGIGPFTAHARSVIAR
jgi:hypothetical protein